MSGAFDRTLNASAKTSRLPCPSSQPYPPPSQRSVAGRYSSQHHERMNHLSAPQRQNRGGERRIITNFAAISDERRQSGLEMLDRFLIHEQAKDGPGETLHGLDGVGFLFKPGKARANHRRPFLVLQRQ